MKEIEVKALLKLIKRFPFFNKYEKRYIDDGIYEIKNFFKDNMYLNLISNENELFLKDKNYSIMTDLELD